VSAVSWSSDANRICSGSSDTTLRVWDVSSGECIRILEGHSSFVRAVSWSSDGNRICSGSDDKTVRVWEVSGGQCIRTLYGHPSCDCGAVAVMIRRCECGKSRVGNALKDTPLTWSWCHGVVTGAESAVAAGMIGWCECGTCQVGVCIPPCLNFVRFVGVFSEVAFLFFFSTFLLL